MKALCVIAGILVGFLAFPAIGNADEPANPFPYADPSFQSISPVIDQFDPPPSGSSETPSESRRPARPDSEADDSGFKWPTLPKPKLPALPKISLPKLSMPTWGSESQMSQRERARQPAEPSSWEKLSSGTKDLFTKTKQTLMPWNQDDDGSTTVRPTSKPRRPTARTPSRTKVKPASAEKKPLFPWFSKQEENEEPIGTVNDFLSQPRLQ